MFLASATEMPSWPAKQKSASTNSSTVPIVLMAQWDRTALFTILTQQNHIFSAFMAVLIVPDR